MKSVIQILRASISVAVMTVFTASVHAQGTIGFANSALTRVQWELGPNTGTYGGVPVGAPIVYGVFWGTNANELELNAGPLGAASTTSSGLIAAPATYPLEGTSSDGGETYFMQIRGWSAQFGRDWQAAANSIGAYFGETGVRSITTASSAGPGTVIWSGSGLALFQPLKLQWVAGISQQIAFGGINARTFGDLPFELTATASSGLPVQFRSDNASVASISGATLTIRGAGLAVITASQPGNINYYPAGDVSQTLVVNSAPATIQLVNLQRVYDGAIKAAGGLTTPPGLSVTYTYNGSPTPPSNVGAYEVVATIRGPNYIGTTNGLLVIERATQSISFPEPARTVVASAPVTLQVSASSGLPVQFVSSDPAAASVNGITVTPLKAGVVTITARQPGNSNYLAATDVAQSFYIDCLLIRTATTGGRILASPDQTTYPPGTEVTLTAQPDPGFGFIRWNSDLTGNTNPTRLVLDTNRSVSAVFASLAITLGVQGEGVVRKSPDLPIYELGQSVTLTARPDRWRVFSAWSDGATENPRTVVIGEFNAYTAIFIPETPLETVTIGGVSRVAPVGMPAFVVDGAFILGSNVSVRGSATVSIASTFAGRSILFTKDGTVPGFSSAFYNEPLAVKRSMTLRAVAYNTDFTKSVQSDPLRIEVLPAITATTPGGGTISMNPPSGVYRADGTVVVTATPAPGWTFLQWLGDAAGRNSSAMVLMDRPRCIRAIFGTPVSTSVVGEGSVLRSGISDYYPYGSTLRISALPNAGEYFAFWGTAASGTNNPLSYLVTAPQPTITAVFTSLPEGSHALAVSPDGFGRVTTFPRGNSFRNGTNVTLTATPEAGQSFIGWSGDVVGTNNPLVVTMNKSRTIVASFTRRPTLSVPGCDGLSNRDAFHLVVTGDYGGQYTIEGSTNLAHSWTPLGVLSTPFSEAQFDVPISASSRFRFHRAEASP